MNQQPRRVDFEIFTFHVKAFAIGAHSVTAPFAARANINAGLGYVVKTVLAPPFGKLAWIADRLEDTGRRGRDEDFGYDCIVVGSNCGSCHLLAPCVATC